VDDEPTLVDILWAARKWARKFDKTLAPRPGRA
jgi:hypothetical protein